MILSRYLTREVVNHLFIVMTILLLALLSQQVVRYLNYIAVGKIPTTLFLTLLSFEIPYLLAVLLPLGLYLAILLGFGRLYQDHEIPIMLISGFTKLRIFTVILFLALNVVVLILILMLYVNPQLAFKRQNIMKSDEATLHLIKTLMPGRFQVSSDGKRVMYVEKVSRDHLKAQNIFLANQKKVENTATQYAWTLMLAEEGYQVREPQTGEPLFMASNGYHYEGIPGQNDFKIIHFKKYTARLPQNPMQPTHFETEALSTKKLIQHYHEPTKAAELQWRFSIAISALLLACIAVPLSTARSNLGRYIFLLPAILVFLVYIQLLYIARKWVEQEMVSIQLGMWWVHIVFVICFIFVWFYYAKSTGLNAKK